VGAGGGDGQIVFNSLFTITNMPIKRFADFLLQRHELESYMQLLVDNFNPAAVAGLMCREIVRPPCCCHRHSMLRISAWLHWTPASCALSDADFQHAAQLTLQLILTPGTFPPCAKQRVWCGGATQVSVRWDGQLYDCDFNQQLDLRIPGRTQNIADVGALAQLTGTRVFTDSHCFGCTAGAGSSCSGTTA
jgi:hypothetical protein